MAVTIQNLDDGRGAELDCRGVVTSRELIDAKDKIYQPDRLRVLRYQIIDFTGLHGLYVSSGAIVRLAEEDRVASETNPDLCIAIVADRDCPYGLWRMWQAYLSECPLRSAVFRRREEAMEWLMAQRALSRTEGKEGMPRESDETE